MTVEMTFENPYFQQFANGGGGGEREKRNSQKSAPF